jgi:hypothetical protein
MRRFFVKMSAAAIIAASTVAALQGGASASTHIPLLPSSSSTVYTGHVTSPGRTFVPAPKPGQCGGCLA